MIMYTEVYFFSRKKYMDRIRTCTKHSYTPNELLRHAHDENSQHGEGALCVTRHPDDDVKEW